MTSLPELWTGANAETRQMTLVPPGNWLRRLLSLIAAAFDKLLRQPPRIGEQDLVTAWHLDQTE